MRKTIWSYLSLTLRLMLLAAVVAVGSYYMVQGWLELEHENERRDRENSGAVGSVDADDAPLRAAA